MVLENNFKLQDFYILEIVDIDNKGTMTGA